jgi:hypothetical protein
MFHVGAGFEFFEPADVDVVAVDAVEEERVVELAGHPADIGGSGGNGDYRAELIWADGQPVSSKSSRAAAWAAGAARDYLRLRNSLGHDLAECHRELPRFVAFLEAEGLPTVTVAAALAWAHGPDVDPPPPSRRGG